MKMEYLYLCVSDEKMIIYVVAGLGGGGVLLLITALLTYFLVKRKRNQALSNEGIKINTTSYLL